MPRRLCKCSPKFTSTSQMLPNRHLGIQFPPEKSLYPNRTTRVAEVRETGDSIQSMNFTRAARLLAGKVRRVDLLIPWWLYIKLL